METNGWGKEIRPVREVSAFSPHAPSTRPSSPMRSDRTSLGFYTEDSRVGFDNIEGSIVEPFEGYPIQRLRDGDRLGDSWEVAFAGYGYIAIESS